VEVMTVFSRWEQGQGNLRAPSSLKTAICDSAGEVVFFHPECAGFEAGLEKAMNPFTMCVLRPLARATLGAQPS